MAAAAAAAAAARRWQLALLLALLGLLVDLGTCGTFTLINNCASTVWVATQSNAGVAPLQLGTKARLDTGQSLTVSVPSSWGGRFWGRTGCAFSGNGGTGVACTTGDCGNGAVDCNGSGGKPPATLAEFTLAGYNNKDYYDVSLVDGYNLPLSVFPTGGGSARNVSDDKSCGTAGCTGDLNQNCPSQLRIAGTDGSTVGCRSACEAFGGPQYCCTGANNTPKTCPPTDYSKTFKSACPKAYSYAYDDASSIFTCESGAYTITFCPTNLPEIPQAVTTPPPSGDVPSSSTGVPSTGDVPPSSSGEVPSVPASKSGVPAVPATGEVPPSSSGGVPSVPASESGVPAVPATGGVPDPGTDGATYSTVGTNFRIVTQASQAAAGMNAVSWLVLLLCLGLLQAATTLRVSLA